MALLLEKLNLRCTWEIHVDTQRDNWGWRSVWDRRTGVKDVGVIRIKVIMKMQTVGALGLWGGHGEPD